MSLHKTSIMVKSAESSVRFGHTQKDQVDPTLAFSVFIRGPTTGKVLTYTKDRSHNKGNCSQWGWNAPSGNATDLAQTWVGIKMQHVLSTHMFEALAALSFYMKRLSGEWALTHRYEDKVALMAYFRHDNVEDVC